ncbi:MULTISPECIES: DUF945 family protein [unclassified Ectothiorhodospira]|uniref:DUF945 family protein n=1 Tax=unclassified Ectothiorhodospira TaxID=2684909 RepID=UPI001EE96F29|nr:MULTISPECIES: DUF945 family protein [unclassified Ectothiorhodospira]MCG5514515.1 YdgA family protein [Ectothiorhodospira sp. 9100]MCG5518681.1 YdgA family protein [Ectothiorhodospira sp. 9905]
MPLPTTYQLFIHLHRPCRIQGAPPPPGLDQSHQERLMSATSSSTPSPRHRRKALLILALLLALAVIVVGANHQVHRAAEDQVESTLQRWRDQPPDVPGVHLRWADYDRDSGDLQYRIRYIPEENSVPWQMLADLQGTDSPTLETSGTAQITTRGLMGLLGTIARVEGGLMVSDTWRSLLPDFEGDEWLRYHMNLDSRGRHHLALAGRGYEGRILDDRGEGTGETAWQPWSLEARLASEDRLADLDASLPRLWLREENSALDALVEDLNLHLEDITLDQGLTMIGASALSMQQLSVEDPGGTLVLRDMALNWNNHREDDRLRDWMDLSLGYMSLNGDRILDQARLQINSDLSFEALQDLMAVSDTLNLEDDLSLSEAKRLEQAMTSLLRRGGEIKLERLSLTQEAHGTIEGHATLGLDENAEFNPGGGLHQWDTLYGDVRFTLDEPLIQALMARSIRAQWPHINEAQLDKRVKAQWREWSAILGMMPFVTEWEDQRITLALELEAGVLKAEGRQVMNLRDLMGMF